MSDTLPPPNANKPLGNQAKELEDSGHFSQALDLYHQLYAQQSGNSFAASGYLRCLRKLNRAEEAVVFGRELPASLLNNPYVHRAIAWAIYDHYFKKSEDDNEDLVEPEGMQRASIIHQYEQMQKAAKYVLEKSPIDETLIRIKIVFGMCTEAKQRERWQDMYYFATQLAPEHLSKEPKVHEGRQYMPDYQRWLYKMLKPTFELQRYDECLQLAQQGCINYPSDKNFPWWQALAKRALGQTEEALSELQSLNKRFQEWYIQRDIADVYTQLQQYQEAWIWYCKAALLPGKLHTRYKMFCAMATLLQHLERWQDAYTHIQLAQMIAEHEGWSRPAEMLRTQLAQLATQYPIQVQQDNVTNDFQTTARQLKQLWRREISAMRPRLRGTIKTMNERSGFIYTEKGDYYFSMRDIPRHLPLAIGTTVEFELEESYDQKKQRESFKAVHVWILR